MLGADALVKTLADCGVDACFANPGTSEMHLVTALDREPRIRSVLCLFEGVATGAADGYARIAGKPAMTLLHLGPGYLNGGANLHNARRAFAPTINVVGDHATHHLKFDAPLTSDIVGLVRPLAGWLDVAQSAVDCGPKAADAFAASFGPPGCNAFLILPADAAWTEGGAAAPARAAIPLRAPRTGDIEAAVDAIRAAAKPAILVSGSALAHPEGLQACARLTAAGVQVHTATFPALQHRGAGLFSPPRLPYFGEMATAALDGVDLLIAAGCDHPVAFFAYPGKPSELTPESAARLSLGGADTDSAAALIALCDALKAPPAPAQSASATLDAPTGPLHPGAIGISLARHLPENAIIADDAVTSGLALFTLTEAAAPHDWMFHTGGAIGQGGPMAVGAAVAAPDRKVLALLGDGAAMYTIQSLWTMAREKLNVLTIIFANRSYRILNVELARTGAGNPGPTAASMLALDNPVIDFVSLAKSMGVDAVRCETAEDFDKQLPRLLAQNGPTLIEAVI